MRDICEEYGGLFHLLFPGSLCAASVHQRMGIQDAQTTLERPEPTKGPCAHYHPLAWFLQDLLGFSQPRSLTSQVPLCSDPRKLRKTKFNLSSDLVYTPISKPL